MKNLDVITIGRAGVDLYGAQVGGRLEDMGSFRKYIGGAPTNIACGTARLGLRSALITRVGDEHMGRFIREQLEREGVETSGVITDPERLTGLAILGMRDQNSLPLIHYRENCADMALAPGDISEALIASSRSVLATGTHLTHPRTEGAVLKALDLAKKHGALTALDIDFQSALWSVTPAQPQALPAGESVAKLRASLPLFDLIVGSEAEFHLAGGSSDTVTALRAVRAATLAVLVVKRGAEGAVAFPGAIPSSLAEGEAGPGLPSVVLDGFGVGDGFFSGLLKGWLEEAAWAQSLAYAHACAAFAASRQGCAQAYPSSEELAYLLRRGPGRADLRQDAALAQLHWSRNRQRRGLPDWQDYRIFAFDHRMQIEALEGYTPERGARFKELCLAAARQVQAGRPGYGILCDGRIGRAALHAASGQGLWVGRPCEWPGSRPLSFEPELGADCGGLADWPRENVVKVLCFCHPDDPPQMRSQQEASVRRLFTAARRNDLEFLLEIIPSKVGACDDQTTAKLIRQFYKAGIYPDWWKLEPATSDIAWRQTIAAIEEFDPETRGILVLGLDAPEEDLAASFDVAARHDLVKGFAVGRTLFGKVAEDWMRGEGLDDRAAIASMAERFARLSALWDRARAKSRPIGDTDGGAGNAVATAERKEWADGRI